MSVSRLTRWSLVYVAPMMLLMLMLGDPARADDGPSNDPAAEKKDGEHPQDEGAKGEGKHGAEPAGGHGGHAAHDPHDLSHLNASPALEDPAQFRKDLAIWTFVMFLALLAILYWFAWGPIMDGLQRREQSIADTIERARLDAEAASKQLAEYERKLDAAVDEAREIVAQAKRDADDAGQKIVAEAKTEAERQVERAKSEIETAKNVAIQQLAERSVDTAVALAGRMIHKEITAADHAQLIKDAVEQFPSKN